MREIIVKKILFLLLTSSIWLSANPCIKTCSSKYKDGILIDSYEKLIFDGVNSENIYAGAADCNTKNGCMPFCNMLANEHSINKETHTGTDIYNDKVSYKCSIYKEISKIEIKGHFCEVYYSKRHVVNSLTCQYCNQDDTNFTEAAYNQRVDFTWDETEDKSQQCNDINGTVQSRRMKCKMQYRCLTTTDDKECDENQTLDMNATPPMCVDNEPECTEEDTSYHLKKP